MTNARRFLALTAAAAISLVASTAAAADPVVGQVAVGEIAESAGIDSASVRTTAEGEIAQIDLSKLPAKRRYLVSLSLARSSIGDSVACTVNAMLRDAKTGAMIAIIEAGAQAAGSTSDDAARRVAHAAVRSAMRRIPTALSTK